MRFFHFNHSGEIMQAVEYTYLTDEQAAVQIEAMTNREVFDLGSASITVGLDKDLKGKIIIVSSSGRCAIFDYPFVGSESFDYKQE